MAKKKITAETDDATDAGVHVRVTTPGGLNEDGVRHEAGAVFLTTATRASALGDLVEAAEAPSADED
jgi:hypothetical protein